VVRPPVEVHRGRAALVVGLSLTVLAIGLISLTRSWSASGPHEAATATPATSGAPTTAAGNAVLTDPLAPFGGVDVGPWPMIHHDPQRSNRSHLRGPAPGVGVRPLFTLPAITPVGHTVPLAVTPDGTIVAGACGFVDGLAPDGQRRWRVPLGTPGRLEEPGGIALSPGLVSLTTRDCPDSPDTSPRVGLYRIAGSSLLRDSHPGAPWGPTIAPEMPTITIDEFTMVRAYDHVPRFLWANDLPGYSSVPPAVGIDGAFFVLTDGGMFNQPSLWAIERDGRVRWSATDVRIPSQIAITPSGAIIVPDREQRRVHAISPRDASVLWTREIEGQLTLATLAVAATGEAYVRSTTALTALTPDGSVRWRFAPGGDGGLGLAPLVDVEGHVYVAFGDRVYSLTSTGELRWEAEVPKARDLFIAADGVLYVVSGDQVLVAIEGQGSR
jgi:outer membrane protein assembly factor BamB